MRDPRSFVDAATPAVADVLTEMTRTVLTGGGVLHPGLTMVEREGALTVRCVDSTDAAPGQPLFEVPREMLIPVAGAQWADSQSTLVLTAPPPGLTHMQRDLLDLHVALYNACGKLPWIIANHPRLGLADAPDVVAAIQALRPGFTEARAEPGLTPSASAPPLPDSGGHTSSNAGTTRSAVPPAIEVFLNTRVFGLKPVEPAALTAPEANGPTNRPYDRTPAEAAGRRQDKPPSGPDPTRRRVLLPLIDLLNHHPKGASLRVDARAMTPAVARPTGTDECFANYGHRRDGLDLALNYGYVDTATRFVHCPPMTVDVPGVGTLRILGPGSRGKPPSPLAPPRVTSVADGLAVSHIVFREPQQGVRWQLPVAMAVQARAARPGTTQGQPLDDPRPIASHC